MNHPLQIQIVSDANVLKLAGVKKDVITYVYTDSLTKVGVELKMDENQLTKMIKNEIIKTL